MLSNIITGLCVFAMLFLVGCGTVKEYFEDVDYDAIYEKADKVALTLHQSAETIERTQEVAQAVRTLRGDYRAFKEEVSPYIDLLSSEDRARVVAVDKMLVDLGNTADEIVETKVNGQSVVSAIEAARLVGIARVGIKDLISIADANRDKLDSDTNSSLDIILGKWAVVESLISNIESKADNSVKVDKIKNVLSIMSKALPIALKVIQAVKR